MNGPAAPESARCQGELFWNAEVPQKQIPPVAESAGRSWPEQLVTRNMFKSAGEPNSSRRVRDLGVLDSRPSSGSCFGLLEVQKDAAPPRHLASRRGRGDHCAYSAGPPPPWRGRRKKATLWMPSGTCPSNRQEKRLL